MSQPAKLLVLHGARTSVVLQCEPNGVPLWRYWGARLTESPLEVAALRSRQALPSFTLETDPSPTVFPTFGFGWFGQSALLGHRQGLDFAQSFRTTAINWTGPTGFEIELTDEVGRLGICLAFSMGADSDVLEVRTRLTNKAAEVFELQWLAAATLVLPAHARTVRHYHGMHNQEFGLQEDVLGRGQWRRVNRHGITSHDCFPGAVVTTTGTTLHSGCCYGAQLAWSGNHVQSLDWLDDGRYQWQLGEWLAPGEMRLGPGEELESPVVLATCSLSGLNGLAQNFHTAARERIHWPAGRMRARPVHLNTWEAMYFDQDEANLRGLAQIAADLGVERLVLDDGWFHRRVDDRRALGDWWPDAGKYPAGLGPLARHVTGLGLEFGLWVEPEMVNPDSELYRNHPDWALQIAGRPRLTARNQLVLNLALPEVSQYLYERLDSLLRELPIGYLKWDHNRNLAPAAGADGRASFHRQVRSAYALLQRIRHAHPAVEIESCAGGGGRIDAGILPFVHRFWTSDCLDALERLTIQSGFLQFFPPELMGSHVGGSPAHNSGRKFSLDFRAQVALPGHFGLELNLLQLPAEQLLRLKSWIVLYKRLRSHLHGTVWLGDAGDHVQWHACGTASHFVVFVYRRYPSQQRYAPSVRLPFVSRSSTYRIDALSPDPSAPAEAFEVAGAWLCEVGIELPAMLPASALLYEMWELDAPGLRAG